MARTISAKKNRWVLTICNAAIMIAAIAASLVYANRQQAEQLQAKQTDFITTVESMKAVSQNYLDSERGYTADWAGYISSQHMTLPQALDFLRHVNTNSSRFCHIVDMDTFEAWSAYYPPGEEAIDTYKTFQGDRTDYESRMFSNMWDIYNGTEADFSVMGKYMLQESLSTAVSIGSRVTLQTGTGSKDYLLLRAIPTDALRRSWVFPSEYQTAEIGIITRSGSYLIQSPSMKSQNFPEYIRGYNFQDDYNRMYTFRAQLMNSTEGLLRYKNFRGTDCYWYYSSFGDGSDLDILSMIQVDELQPSGSLWGVVLLICGSLAVLIFIDGSYLIRINTQLREAAQRAEEASYAKTRFLSAMSHDIRTPMNAILGMISIARQNINNPDYVLQCLDKSARAGRQLLTLINDVLDISKIESGAYVLSPAELSLPGLMEELEAVLQSQAQEKQQQLTFDYQALPSPVVLADAIRLNQIFVNLISNAIKYTPNGGRIAVELKQEAAENPENTRVIFRVSDNGIGMSQEFQQQMYHSFSRAVNTQVNRTQGSGLGLAIVHQMVDLMHGTIQCDSAEGKGTTFEVRLEFPVVRQPQRVYFRKDSTGSKDVSGLHLLVAEDNDLNWEIIQALLQELGVSCDRAENGRLCLERISSVPMGTYDAIFMDIQMPEMTGLEAATRIRALPAEQNGTIPIVAMTADAFAEDVQTCFACGMNAHIAKPVDTKKLFLYLQEIKNHTL